jgi:hypothetical protein
MKKSPPASAARRDGDAPLTVWGERHRDPDWDRFLAALIALALRRVEEAEQRSEEDADG